jgi:N-acetylmuramoyl-L-alanine amidase
LRVGFFIVAVAALIGGMASAGDKPAVLAVRAADHDGVTRIVLEVTAPITFQQADDSDARHLEVTLPALDWRADPTALGRGVGLVHKLTYALPDAASGRLDLETSRPAVVRKMFLIPPSGNGNYRLVLDLEATSVSAASSRTPIAAGALPPTAAPVAAPPPRPQVTPASLPEIKPAEPSRKERHPGKPIVVLDPGHGGVDPGATSVSGAYEKNIVLALAQDVKAQLDKNGKVTAILTRDRDIFIPLRERVAIARAANADLFMSLHADIVADSDIRGLSVYTLSQNASDAEAQALADKENKSDIVAGIDFSNESPEVTNILIDLVQRESMNLSAKFAGSVITEVSRDTHQLLQNTHRFAGFAVLKAPDVPSVLVESGYLSNERDEQMLRRPEYRAKLAQALARAIENFLAKQQKMRRS